MKVSELGEFGLINILAKMVDDARDNGQVAWRKLLVGIGDDAAAWESEPVQLATIDALIQDVHFSLDITPWEDLGWKAMAVNLSDIAAMGGRARYALVSLALPGHIEVEDVAALYRGMMELARSFGVVVIGGNISGAPQVAIHVTVLGSQSRAQNLLRRNTAIPGDIVAVTGQLGAAAGGLEMLTGKLAFDSEASGQLRTAFLRPFPRVAEGQVLIKDGIRTAIDISDGLVSDLEHICEASGVGARIEVDRIPVAGAVRANFGDRALELALTGGEDYELLFTGRAEAVAAVTKDLSCPVTIIGEIVALKAGEERISLVDSRGSKIKMDRMGWEHFRK